MPTPRPAVKELPKSFLPYEAGYCHRNWFLDLTTADQALSPVAGVTLADLFTPRWWIHHVQKLKRHDLIRVVAHDWDLVLSVTELTGFGVAVRPHNWVAPGSETALMLEQLIGPLGPADVAQMHVDAEIAGMKGAMA